VIKRQTALSRSETCEAKTFGTIDEVFDKRPEAGDDSGTGTGDVTPA
jgi:ATP-dependent Clp protease protease subunit